MDDVQNKRGFWALNFLQKRSRLRKLLRLQKFPRGKGRMTEGQGKEAEREAHPRRRRGRAEEPLKEHCDHVCCISTLPRVPVATGSTAPFSFLNRVSIYFSCASPWNVGLAGTDNLLLALLHVTSQEQ